MADLAPSWPIVTLAALALLLVLGWPRRPYRRVTNLELLAMCTRAWPDFRVAFVEQSIYGRACAALCTEYGHEQKLATILTRGATDDYAYRLTLEAACEKAERRLRASSPP